jgi:hypothetical protein
MGFCGSGRGSFVVVIVIIIILLLFLGEDDSCGTF